MACSTHIVECLRNEGIEPFAFASSESGASYASNALDYLTESTFYPKSSYKNQYWAVYFKKTVNLQSYQIKAGTSSSSLASIYRWTMSTSMDNLTWTFVSSPAQGNPGDKIFTLDKPINARYVRIEGSSLYSVDTSQFWFYHIKFFGSLSPMPSNRCQTCKLVRNLSFKFLFYHFFLCS